MFRHCFFIFNRANKIVCKGASPCYVADLIDEWDLDRFHETSDLEFHNDHMSIPRHASYQRIDL